MTTETHEIEYKDFSKSKQLDKKVFVSKLFKEISGFANSKGGKIIVGKEDKTGKINPQPQKVIEWLENDRFTSEINRISDNLVIFKCEENKGVININIQEAEDVISANIDFKGINKGDCFVRENHQAVIAKGNTLKNLIEKKAISVDNRLNKLRKVVHYKFSMGKNITSELNIFDSLVVSIESTEDYISTLFDQLISHEFMCAYSLPVSKYTTIEMHIDTVAAILKIPNPTNSSVIMKRDVFKSLEKKSGFMESFIKSHRDNALTSVQLKNYLLEHKTNIGE